MKRFIRILAAILGTLILLIGLIALRIYSYRTIAFKTGSKLAPSFYLMFAAAISACALLVARGMPAKRL